MYLCQLFFVDDRPKDIKMREEFGAADSNFEAFPRQKGRESRVDGVIFEQSRCGETDRIEETKKEKGTISDWLRGSK